MWDSIVTVPPANMFYADTHRLKIDTHLKLNIMGDEGLPYLLLMFGTKFLKEILSSHYFIIPLPCLGALSLVQ